MSEAQVKTAYEYLARLCAKSRGIENPTIIIREKGKSDTKAK